MLVELLLVFWFLDSIFVHMAHKYIDNIKLDKEVQFSSYVSVLHQKLHHLASA